MATRLFALIAGIWYTALGIVSFFPICLWHPELARFRQEYIYFHPGYLAGFIPVNWPHNILWIAMGVGGLLACVNYASAKLYAQGLFVATVLLTIAGILPLGIGSLWGFLPLFGWNVLLHAMTAMLAWYYGFVYPYGKRLRIVQ